MKNQIQHAKLSQGIGSAAQVHKLADEHVKEQKYTHVHLSTVLQTTSVAKLPIDAPTEHGSRSHCNLLSCDVHPTIL